MKCMNCGIENPQEMRFCGNCGKALLSPTVEPSKARNRQCVECGRTIDWDAIFCTHCGHNYQATAKPGTEGYLMTGAVLTILASILGLVLLTLVLDSVRHLDVDGMVLFATSYICAALGFAGGLAALMRKWFPIAVLGGVCAIFTPAFYFAIPGLALIARSAASFKDYNLRR